MITGDNKLTAEAIAEDIGIFRAGEDISSKSMTGKQQQVFQKGNANCSCMLLEVAEVALYLLAGGLDTVM